MQVSMTLSADTRYTFTGQFLETATLFARRARLIEEMVDDNLAEELRCDHRGVVSAASSSFEKILSRSWMTKRYGWSPGSASRNCCNVHSAVGCEVAF